MTRERPPEFRHLERSATWGALLAALLLIATGLITRMASADGRLIASLQWFDVALVQIFCALPIAWWAGVWSGRVRPVARVMLVVAGLIVVAVMAASSMKTTTGIWLIESVLVSTIVVLGASLCTVLIVGFCNPAGAAPFSAFTAASLLMVAYVVSATWLHARLRHEAIQLAELLDQSRYGEALATARPIARLEPQTVINGRPIDEVLKTLSRGVAVLESQASAPLPSDATDDFLLARSRALAMLGRTDDALAVLGARSDPGVDGLLLEGMIRETRAEWDRGLEKYAGARTALENQATDPSTMPRRIQAIRGVAYCARKAGRTSEAEAAYQALLAVSPTADAHFLAAQFYEDAQLTSLALRHAKQAIALDPQRFGESGRTLIDKLQTLHFGCWGVYTSGLAETVKPDVKNEFGFDRQ